MAYATKFRLAVQTHQGMVRKNNEDSFAVTRPGEQKGYLMSETAPVDLVEDIHPNSAFDRIIITVADGMGGTNAGEVAARIAVETINEVLLTSNPATPIKNLLLDAIDQANKKIIDYSQKYPLSAGMGTTCIIAAVDGHQIHIAWIGDSRAYLFNPETGLTQLSKDHSLVQELVDLKQLTMEEAFYHPDSNIITQSLGEPDRTLDPGFLTVAYQDQDVLMLCSDGLNCMLQDREIGEIISTSYTLSALEIASRLIAVANEEGGQDNTTIAVYKRTFFQESFGEQQPVKPAPEETIHDNWVAPALTKGNLVSVPGSPKPSAKRIRSIVMFLLVALIGGYMWWWQDQKDKKDKKEVMALREKKVRDSLATIRTDSLYQAEKIKKNAAMLAQHVEDSIAALILLQITSNSTDSLSATRLVDALKAASLDAVCDCRDSPYTVQIRVKTQAAADSLKADFLVHHKGILKKYKLNQKDFRVPDK